MSEDYFDDKYYRKVIQQKSDYYTSEFNEMRKNKTNLSFNLSGFLFTFNWMIYRKMYALGFGILLIKISTMFLGRFESIVSFIIRFICALYGNYLYLRHCEKNINKVRGSKEDLMDNRLKKVGGVSYISLILPLLIIFIATGIYAKYNPAPY